MRDDNSQPKVKKQSEKVIPQKASEPAALLEPRDDIRNIRRQVDDNWIQTWKDIEEIKTPD